MWQYLIKKFAIHLTFNAQNALRLNVVKSMVARSNSRQLEFPYEDDIGIVGSSCLIYADENLAHEIH